MTISLQYSGQLRTVTGTSAESVSVGQDSVVAGLIKDLSARHGRSFSAMALNSDGSRLTVLTFVNGTQAGLQTHLKEGDSVAFLSPISGG